jgi:hypothetical protein
MTPARQKVAESDARADAKKLALLLLLLFRRAQSPDPRKITFDESTLKFRIDGRAVSITSIRMYLQRIQDRFARQLVLLTLQLEKGEITIAAWQREFERTITSGHILAGALILGSISSSVNHRAVLERIDEQLRFLDAFGEAIRARQAGSFGKIRARAKSYLQAIHLTFTGIELQQRIALGVETEARRRLRPAEHCHNSIDTPGCIELALKDWIPIDEMVPIGQATCTIWCKCFIEYR